MTLDEIALGVFIASGMIIAGASIYSQIRDGNYHKSLETPQEAYNEPQKKD